MVAGSAPTTAVGVGKRRWGRYRDTGPTAATRATVRARSGGRCEIVLPGCWTVAADQHHRLNRKAGGRHRAGRERVNGVAWQVHTCRPCHRAVTSAHGPALADYRARGLVLREHQDAERVPIRTGRWPGPVWLGADGSVRATPDRPR